MTTYREAGKTMVSPAELVDRLLPLIDSDAGILDALRPLPLPDVYAGHAHGFATVVARTDSLHRSPRGGGVDFGELAGFGTSLDESTASVRAVCEGLERYCAVMYPDRGVNQATARELGQGCLDPRRLPQCSQRERQRANPAHRLKKPDLDSKEKWVEGYSLTEARAVWVPITTVYLGLPVPLTEHLRLPESTGFAVGTSYEQAILSGLCEVIERDSLALWWLHQLSMPRIDVRITDQVTIRKLIALAENDGVSTHLFNLTTDLGIPVVGLIQITDRGTPHAVCIGACRLDLAQAAIRVLEEAISLRIALRLENHTFDPSLVLSGAPQPPEAFGLYYAGPRGASSFAFALSKTANTVSVPTEGMKEFIDLKDVVRRLTNANVEVIAVDVTQPEIRAFGIVCVRVISPELMPISFAHSIRYLAHSRLHASAYAMGIGARDEHSVTSLPYPYA